MILGYLNSRWPIGFAVLIPFCLGIMPALYSQDSRESGNDPGTGKIQGQGSLPGFTNFGATPQNQLNLLEPTTGLDGFVWGGKKFSISDTRLFIAKFSGYLNEPQEDILEEKEYQDILLKILDTLDVFRVRGSKKKLLEEILPLLQKAMRNPRDGGQCRSIYNAIGSDVHGRDDIINTKARLAELAKDVEKIRWNMQISGNPSTMEVQSNPFALSKAKIAVDQYQTSLEMKLAEMKALSEQAQNKVSDSRLAIQRVIVTLFLGRRFDHVLLATSIYRFLYSDGAGELRIEDSIISAAAESAKKMRAPTSFDRSVTTNRSIGFGLNGAYSNSIVEQKNTESGILSMLPSMSEALDKQTSLKLAVMGNIPKDLSELESVVGEVIDQTNRMMKSIKSLMAQGEYEQALQRLQEAFFPGEHLSSLRTFSWEKRQELWKYLRAKERVLASASGKDYLAALQAMSELDFISKSNPFAKEKAEIENLKKSSDMYIAKAKDAATRGDYESMNKAIEESAKIWPQNPELGSMIKERDKAIQGKEELRELLQQKNYKYIINEKAKFLALAYDEPALLEQLKNVLASEGKAFTWKVQIEELLKRGDPYGAWEDAEKGIADHPGNTDLMKLRSDAAVKCPEYVDKIERARSAESKDDPAAALASYLAARQIYPQSALARDGIARLSKKLLLK